MSSDEQLLLLMLQEEAERLLCELLKGKAGDPQNQAALSLLRTVQHVLQEAQQVGEAAGLFDDPLPWWQDWQRQHAGGS